MTPMLCSDGTTMYQLTQIGQDLVHATRTAFPPVYKDEWLRYQLYTQTQRLYGLPADRIAHIEEHKETLAALFNQGLIPR